MWTRWYCEAHRRAADRLKSPARSKEWRDIKRPAKKLRLRIRLDERVKKIFKLITQIPARLDGTEVDSIGRGMDWQERDYDVAYKIRTQIRAGYGWRKVLDELTNAERRRLNRMQIESDDLSRKFFCDRRESTDQRGRVSLTAQPYPDAPPVEVVYVKGERQPRYYRKHSVPRDDERVSRSVYRAPHGLRDAAGTHVETAGLILFKIVQY